MIAKVKKILAWIGLILLILIATGLAIRAIFNYINGKKLERYFSEMKAKGMPSDFSAILQPCAADDNAALLWKAVESLLILENDDKSLLAQVSEISEWKEFSPEEKKKLEAVIEKNRKTVELMLEAATKKCFQYGDRSKPVFERELPNFTLMIQATRLLIVDSLFKADKGQINEAIDQILKGISFMKIASTSPTLMNFLVSMANTRMLIYNLNRIVSGRDVPETTLVRILDSLVPLDWRKALVKAAEAEHVGFALETLRRLIKGEVVSDLSSSLADRLYLWLFRPIVKSEIIWVSKQYGEMIEAAQEPFYRNEKAQLWAGQEIKVPAQYRLARLLLPNLYTIILKEATLEAYLEAARTGIGCRLYRSRLGRYPEKISDLVPMILKEEPLDPFTGQPLLYHVKDTGFIVYSVGSNKKDDNGQMSVMTQATMEKDDDWSWRENWKINEAN